VHANMLPSSAEEIPGNYFSVDVILLRYATVRRRCNQETVYVARITMFGEVKGERRLKYGITTVLYDLFQRRVRVFNNNGQAKTGTVRK
jgi:hypothetical protein